MFRFTHNSSPIRESGTQGEVAPPYHLAGNIPQTKPITQQTSPSFLLQAPQILTQEVPPPTYQQFPTSMMQQFPGQIIQQAPRPVIQQTSQPINQQAPGPIVQQATAPIFQQTPGQVIQQGPGTVSPQIMGTIQQPMWPTTQQIPRQLSSPLFPNAGSAYQPVSPPSQQQAQITSPLSIQQSSNCFGQCKDWCTQQCLRQRQFTLQCTPSCAKGCSQKCDNTLSPLAEQGGLNNGGQKKPWDALQPNARCIQVPTSSNCVCPKGFNVCITRANSNQCCRR
uniref:ShKT domain-containing protein n=1 Tax=Ascaris lumbricoides TaxID=6252 RepID=A0A0M3IEX5_ASCLU